MSSPAAVDGVALFVGIFNVDKFDLFERECFEDKSEAQLKDIDTVHRGKKEVIAFVKDFKTANKATTMDLTDVVITKSPKPGCVVATGPFKLNTANGVKNGEIRATVHEGTKKIQHLTLSVAK